MKMKNVSFFQRHVEKIVLLVAAVILVAVVYFYWMGEPNAVEISNREVPPGQVDEVIYEQAKELEQRVRSQRVPSALENLRVPAYARHFVAELNEQPLRGDFAVAFSDVPKLPGAAGGTGEPYHVPRVPQPTILASRADLGTIDPMEMQAFPKLAGYFGEEEPYDGAWVSLVGQFDLRAMLEQLQTPGSEGTQKLPERWWDRSFALVDVKVQRQRMRADGTWPEPGDADYDQLTARVQPIPGQLDFGGIPEKVAPEDASRYLSIAQQYQTNIIQPGFYTLRGSPWMPPASEEEGGSQKEQVMALAETIQKNRKLVNNFQRQMKKLQDRSQRASQSRGRQGGRGRGLGRRGAGGAGMGPGGAGMGAGGAAGAGMGAGMGPGGAGMGPGGAGMGPGGAGMGPGGARGARGGRRGAAQSQAANRESPVQRRTRQLQERMQKIQGELQQSLSEYQRITGRRFPPPEPTPEERRARMMARRQAGGRAGMPPGANSRNPSARGMPPGAYDPSMAGPGMMDEQAMMMQDPAMMMEEQAMMNDPAMMMEGSGGMMGGMYDYPGANEQLPPGLQGGGGPMLGRSGYRRGARFRGRNAQSRLMRPTDAQMQQRMREQGPQERQQLGSLLLDPPEVDLQVTDLNVEPGATYRYRMKVSVSNPLFDKRAMPEEQRREYGEKFLLDSEWSGWTAPITVEQMEYFFVLGASPTPEPGRANVEVWRYYDGRWRDAEFRAQPGDPVGEPQTVQLADGREITIDYATNNYLVDLEPNYTVPGSGNSGNSGTETTRVLFMKDGDMVARRLDQDRQAEKKEWLREQQEYSELMGL